MSMQQDLTFLIKARDEASRVVNQVTGSLQKNAETIKAVSRAALVAGGAITAVAALAVKAAQEEQIGINRLNQALVNVGTTYAAQKVAIEAVIEAQQRKTNFGDGPQRDALQKLVTISGSYEQSLKALPVVLDVAAGANIDLNAASLLVGKALAGNTESLGRYGIVMDKDATSTEILAALTAQFGGAAAAAANPVTQLRNRLGDLMEVIGGALLPMVEKAAVVIELITRKAIEWASANPKLAQVITIVVTAIGALLLVLGTLALTIPPLILSLKALGISFTLAFGVIGGIILAITALVAIGVLLYQNWDTIKEKAAQLWNFLRPLFETGINFLIDLFNAWTFVYREGLALLLEGAKKVANVFDKDLAQGIQTAIDAIREGVPQVQLAEVEINNLGDEAQQAEQNFNAIQPEIAGTARELDGVTSASQHATSAMQETSQAITAQQANWMNMQATTKSFQESYRQQMDEFMAGEKTKQDELDRTAQAHQQSVNSAKGSWDSYKFEVSAVGQHLQEHRLSTEQIVGAIAQAWGYNTGEVIRRLELLGIQTNDTEGIIKAFGDRGAQAVLRLQNATESLGERGSAAMNRVSSAAQSTVNSLQAAAKEMDRFGRAIDLTQKGSRPDEMGELGRINSLIQIKEQAIQQDRNRMGREIAGSGNPNLVRAQFADRESQLQREINDLRQQKGALSRSGLPKLDTGGIIQGPGMFQVGAGVKEIIRTPSSGGGVTVNIQGDFFGDQAMIDRLGQRIVEAIRGKTGVRV
jgi:hypothetical protein